MSAFKEHYTLSGFTIVEPNKFSRKDELASLPDLFFYLDKSTGVIIVSGFTTYTRLLGEKSLTSFISQMSGWSKYGTHVIVLTFQCEDVVLRADNRNVNKYYNVDGHVSSIPQLVFLPSNKNRPFFTRVISGIDEFERDWR